MFNGDLVKRATAIGFWFVVGQLGELELQVS